MEAISDFLLETSFVQTRSFRCSLEAVFGDWAHAIFQNDLLRIAGNIFDNCFYCFVSVDFHVPFAFRSLGLSRSDRSRYSRQSKETCGHCCQKPSPVEFTQEPTGPIAEYICHAHSTNMLSAAGSILHGYIRPSSTDLKSHHGYQLWQFSVVGSQWLDPFWPKQ